jgi:hypothetical protein
MGTELKRDSRKMQMQSIRRGIAWFYLLISIVVLYLPFFVIAFAFKQYGYLFGMMIVMVLSHAVFFLLKTDNFKRAGWCLLVPFAGYVLANVIESIGYCWFLNDDVCLGSGATNPWLNSFPALFWFSLSLLVQLLVFRWAGDNTSER